MRSISLCIILLTLGVAVLQAQTPLNKTVTIRPSEVPLSFSEFVLRVEQQYSIRFFLNPEWVDHVYIEQPYTDMLLGRILEQLFTDLDITFYPLADYGIILVKNPAAAIARARLLEEATARKRNIQRLVIGQPADYRVGKKVRLSGKVTDDKNGVPVRNASVEALTANAGTTTSDLGQFELTLSAGTHVLSIRHNNYAEKILDLEIYTDGKAELALEEVPVMLEEVVITDQSIMNSSITTTTLKITDMKRAPVFLGEIDIVRQLQNQAGVTSVGEVAGGFNVRGGSADQNLVLYDGMPVFNSSAFLLPPKKRLP